MGTPQFVDISVFNDPSIDWQAYRAWSQQGDGVSRVAMRSSYGVGFVDQHFAAYRAGALAAGIDQIFYYHYGYPNFNNPVDEADYQHSIVGDIRPQDLIILDYEEDVAQATASWAITWLARQEAHYRGKLPCIYSYPDFITRRLQDSRLAKYPLWYANWTFDPNRRPPAPAPWTNYEAVQYTDKATNIPGIDGSVDASIFLGGGIPHVQTYGPGKGDFDQFFDVLPDGNWRCRTFNTVLLGGNKGLFSQLSIDGNTLPIIGLPRTSELAQIRIDGTESYYWSVQFFERGVMVYDPHHIHDSQPGLGASYLGKYSQFKQYDPEYDPVEITALTDEMRTAISDVKSSVDTLAKVAASFDIK